MRERSKMKKILVLFVLMAAVSLMASGVAVAGSRIFISNLHCNGYGNDNKYPNREYVTFKNSSGARIAMGGWKVHDRGHIHVYTFHRGFHLGPYRSVTLRTGYGVDTASTVHWNKRSAVWNNTGDTATLLDAHGRVVSRRTCR